MFVVNAARLVFLLSMSHNNNIILQGRISTTKAELAYHGWVQKVNNCCIGLELGTNDTRYPNVNSLSMPEMGHDRIYKASTSF